MVTRRFVALALCLVAAPVMAETRGDYYRLTYTMTGMLTRAAAVCKGDPKQMIAAAFAIIGTPEMRQFSKAYPKTIKTWMEDGGKSMNDMVMQNGIVAACETAMSAKKTLEK